MSIKEKKYRIADINVLLATEYEKTISQAKAYEVDDDDESFRASAEVIDIQESYPRINEEAKQIGMPPEAVEYLYSGSIFNRILLKHNGIMLHSSAVVVDGYGYLFSADSGTGKSTHTGLWLEHFKDRAFIINDDKPAIRKVDGEWYVYGTPWSGKTPLNVNTRAKLGGIVFLERSKENWIKQISPQEALPMFMGQTIRKLSKEQNMDALLTTLGQLLSEVPQYRLGCNISEDAVITAYNKIRKV